MSGHWTIPYKFSKHRKALQWTVFSRNWYLFDCKGQDVFDAATAVTMRLQGKHKPIYDDMQDIGDHVVCINSRQLTLPDDEWRWRMYYHHTRYAGGRTWSAAYELHLNDPTIVLYKACYKLAGAVKREYKRRHFMAKLHIFPDDVIPDDIRVNILDQIRGVTHVFPPLNEIDQETKDNFPAITDYPEDYVIKK